MSATTDHITAISRELIEQRGLVDNVFTGRPTMDWFWKNRKMLDGAFIIDWSFYTDVSQMTQTFRAYQDYRVQPQSYAKKASIEPAHYVHPVILSRQEMRAMAGKSQALINYVEDHLTREQESFEYRLSQDLFGSGLDYAHPLFPEVTVEPMQGLDGIIAADRVYAGHDSTTYPALDCYVKTISPAAFADMYTPSDADNLPDALTEILTETDFGGGRKQVDWISTTKIMLEALKRAANRGSGNATSFQQVVQQPVGPAARANKFVAAMGYNSVEFEGRSVVQDWDCPAGKLFALNSDTIYLGVLKGAAMRFEDFQETSDSDKIKANWILSCQVIMTEPRRQAKITGGSTSRT